MEAKGLEPEEIDAALKAAAKAKKKKAPAKGGMPVVEPLPPPKDLSVKEAMAGAVSWNHANVITQKLSIGTLTTASFDQKVAVYESMNQLAADKAQLYPLSSFYGKKPDPKKDFFDRRVIKQLHDIDFEDDESEEDEETKDLRRMPRNILNEENLRVALNDETIRLNLENHYWLKLSFLNKIGRMAPNLLELSLRRLKLITNPAFAEIFKPLK